MIVESAVNSLFLWRTQPAVAIPKVMAEAGHSRVARPVRYGGLCLPAFAKAPTYALRAPAGKPADKSAGFVAQRKGLFTGDSLLDRFLRGRCTNSRGSNSGTLSARFQKFISGCLGNPI